MIHWAELYRNFDEIFIYPACWQSVELLATGSGDDTLDLPFKVFGQISGGKVHHR